MSPRLGKTREAGEHLARWRPKRALICCPLIVAPLWEAQLEPYELGPIVNLYSGPLQERLGRLSTDGIAIANYDVLRSCVDVLIGWRPTALIGDESHLLKSPSAKRARAFRRLAWRADYVRLLTGTPTPNHYGDLWGQMVALDKTEWGTSYERFAQRYLIRDSMFPSVVLGHRNVDELQARMLRYTTIVRRDDAFGPDTWQTVTRTVQMPPKAQHLYDKLVRDWLLHEHNVEAAHVLKRLVRLQQLASGYLPNEDGEVLELHDAKVEAVLADLDEIVESGEKAVVFHRFRWEGERYAREIAARFPDTGLVVINGDTAVALRAALLEAFRASEGPVVAVVQTQSGGVGISFATATHALFVSRGFSFTDDEQARDRIYAPKARRCVTYYECGGTVDEYISAVLGTKQNVHEAVVRADIEALAYGFIRKR